MATRRSKKGEGSLQSSIDEQGYNWTAGQTELSALSIEEQRSFLGLEISKKELQATQQAIAAAEAMGPLAASFAAPTAVDWRNNNGNWVTPVKNQQDCGSCVSFAVLATVEARMNIVCKNQNLDKDLSEAFLFYCGCGNCCGTGWNFPPALDFCKNRGMLDEAVFPYTPGNQPCKPGLPAPTMKLTNWTSLLATADRKNAIASKGPVVAGMAVFQDFYNYTGGVYRHTTGQLVGYHAISCVGYDDTQKCWICKNSWGAGWGEGGFFRIGYGECEIDTSFAMYDVDVACPQPSPAPTDTCERYLPLLRRVLVAAQTNPQLRLCLRYYVCGKGRRPFCLPGTVAVVRAVLDILRACPKYRAPFCRALG